MEATYLYLIRHASPPTRTVFWSATAHHESALRGLRPGDRIYTLRIDRLEEIAESWAEKGEPPRLTAAHRAYVKGVIDAIRRSRIDWDSEPRCSACGVEMYAEDAGEPRYLAGCRTCSDRAAKHRQKARILASQLQLEVAA